MIFYVVVFYMLYIFIYFYIYLYIFYYINIQAISFLKGDKRWAEWPGHAGIGLVIYAQLMKHFGWEAYKKVLPKSLEITKNIIKVSSFKVTFTTRYRLFYNQNKLC